MNQNNFNMDPIIYKKCPTPIKGLVENASHSLPLLHLDFFTLYDFCEWEPQIINSILPALFLNLLAEQNIGSTCLNLNDQAILDSLKLLGVSKPEKAIEKLIVEIKAKKYQKIISDQTTDFLPLFLIERESKFFLYLNKNWDAENKINQRLKGYSQIKPEVNAAYKALLENVFKNSTREFNEEQKKAIETALTQSFVIITGGPGTGKTFTLTGILRILLRSGISINEIALAAPTAKAANRMNESISENISKIKDPTKDEAQLLNLKGTTIHRLLGISAYLAESQYSEFYPLPFKVLVIDEASMIDLNLMNILISSIDPKKTKLILIGDKDQLPSVEEGAVFSDLIENNTMQNVVTLKESYRSHGKLLSFIKSIKNKSKGQNISIPLFPTIDVFLRVQEEPVGSLELNTLTKEQYIHEIKYWARLHFLGSLVKFAEVNEFDQEKIKKYLDQINESKILSVINRGMYGVDGINQVCLDEILSSLHIKKSGHFFHGMPIQILQNNNHLELYNGDIGVIMKNADNYFQAVFIVNNEVKIFSIEKLPPYQMSFATTVHKGQGSEYDHVLLVIPPEGADSVVSKQLLYTGVSRAKRKCLILASNVCFQKNLDKDVKRTSGISYNK